MLEVIYEPIYDGIQEIIMYGAHFEYSACLLGQLQYITRYFIGANYLEDLVESIPMTSYHPGNFRYASRIYVYSRPPTKRLMFGKEFRGSSAKLL